MARVRFVAARADARLLSDGRVGYVVAALGILGAVVVLVPLREPLGLLNIGLLFLVVVALIAARWGRGPGLAASVGANLAFNFFFVPPLYRLRVQEPVNVLELLIFLLVAILTSALLARATAGEAAARRREQEVTVLYELSRLVAVNPNTRATLATIVERIRDIFRAEGCAVLLPAVEGLAPVAWIPSDEPPRPSAFERRAALEAYRRAEIVALGEHGDRRRPRIVDAPRRGPRPAPVLFVPLRVVGGAVGVLQIAGRLSASTTTEDDIRLIEAFADVAALAIDRDRLLHEATRATALAETDRMKTALLSAVSHDLRTPLTAILTSVSSLLQREVAWDEQTRHEFLTAIEGQTLRLTRLVSNLLDLSRIEADAAPPQAGWHDVGELLRDVVEAAALAEGRVSLDVSRDVGDAPFDYAQVSHVVTNLLENAAKFAPAGTPIRVEARRMEECIQVRVVDHGPGIPASERDRVFGAFYRGDETARRVPGTGLGLAICKGFVEAHGGCIHIEETPGGGATVVVTLPVPLGAAASAQERLP